jgi:hypothetical protein
MAIEIKELVIRFSVDDQRDNHVQVQNISTIPQELIKSIVEQCSEKVLSKLNKLTER